jgi:methionine-rich copper-binding protein CopC
MMKTKMTVLTVVLCLIAGGRLALAHAFLDHADPAVGAKVAVSPAEVKIWFDSELSSGTIQVLDSGGKEVDKKDTHLDAKDKKLLVVSVGTLAPGTYRVAWQAVSTDTHKTNDDYVFQVKPQ